MTVFKASVTKYLAFSCKDYVFKNIQIVEKQDVVNIYIVIIVPDLYLAGGTPVKDLNTLEK